MFTDERSNDIRNLWQIGKKLLELKAENLTLTIIQKLTLFIGTMAIVTIGMITAAIVLTFLAISFADFLGQFMSLYWSYLIITGAIIVVFLLVYVLRRQLIFDPLARFLSRLFFD